jgi:hypothetical protein
MLTDSFLNSYDLHIWHEADLNLNLLYCHRFVDITSRMKYSMFGSAGEPKSVLKHVYVLLYTQVYILS